MSNNSYYNDAWRIINEKNQSLVSNYSMEFDGSNDFITISNPTELTDDFTIAAWIYPTRVDNSYEMIYTQGDGAVPFYFSVEDTKLHVYITGIYRTGLNFITADEWQHVAVTRTSGVLNLYRNGVEYNGNRPTQNGTINTNNPGVIGKWYNNTHHFQGKIDQTCIFDYALPATGTNSIATLYGGGTAVTNPMALSPAPVAYYQLGDQTASNNTTEPDPPVQSYLVPNNSLQDYVFNFTSSKITLDSEITLPDNKSTSLWVKFNSVPQTQFAIILSSSTNNWFPLVSKNALGNFVLYYKGGDGLQIAVATTVAAVAGVWYNFVTTGDGSIFNLYINGDNAYAGGVGSDREDVKIKIIGTRPAGGFFVDGQMSNVAFWSGTTLTPSQVNNVYNNGSPNDISSLNPTLWYKLNAQDTFDGTDWTIKDSAGSNDGTSSGMTSANLVQSNLQHISGFSPYALSFDGTNDVINCGNDSSLQITGAMTVSYWFKGQGGSNIAGGVGKLGGSSSRGFLFGMTSTGVIYFYIAPTASSLVLASYSHTPDTNWHHLLGVFNPSTSLELYFDGQLVDTTPTSTSSQYNTSNNLQIGARGDSTGFFNGEMSNAAIWNTNLTSTEITEVYNQGVPSNLNTFSGTAPVSWWQLGSNSSFNTNWDCLDEIGNNDGVSAGNMTEDNITNGVGYSANGLGTSSIEIVGDAPYSSANGLSENMDVLDRVTDVPS